MRYGIRTKNWPLKILPLICIVFFLYLVLTPSISMQLGRLIFANKKTQSDKYHQIPMRQNESTNYITELNSVEVFNSFESKVTLTRSQQFCKNKILRHFYDMRPVTGISLGVFLFYSGYFIRKKRKRFNIPAILIGGHAPPKIN